MRRLLVAGNWKMNGSQAMTSSLLGEIKARLKEGAFAGNQTDILVCPASPYLLQATTKLDKSGISVGSQNVSQFEQGAYTGETELSMLTDLGCDYVILGHSERREFFGEDNKIIADKFYACAQHDSEITPILCVGETLKQHQEGQAKAVINKQLQAILDVAGIESFDNAVIAYEPVWAVGTGEAATPEQAQEIHVFIREKLERLDANIASKIRILYGGSVKPKNADRFFVQPDIDGGLIGGASLKSESFASIALNAEKLKI